MTQSLSAWHIPATLNLRRDRWFWPLWILGLSCMIPLGAGAYNEIMPADPVEAGMLARSLAANPSMLALLGPAFDLTSKGGFTFWRTGGLATCFVAMMAGLAIIRGTRAEEEAGRLELLRSGIVGRHASLFASLATVYLGCVLTGVATTLWAIACELPAAGSIAAGLGMTTLGWLFASLGAILAQIAASARTARAWAVGIGFGGMFLTRMMIDGAGPQTSYAWTTWLIPIEWPMLARPYGGERWWVYAMTAGVALVLAPVAFALESRRDHGAGILADCEGRATARPYLAGSGGLAWRLQRTTIMGWLFSLIVAAAGIGGIVVSMGDLMSSNAKTEAIMKKMGGMESVREGFYIAMMGILAPVAAWMALAMLGRLRSEETSGRTELLLSTAQSRLRQFGAHVGLATAASALALLSCGFVMPLSQAHSDGRTQLIGHVASDAAVLVVGVLFVIGVMTFLQGIWPKAAWVSWLILAWSIFCTWFAALLTLPEWVSKVHPWGYLPRLPRDAFDVVPLALELGISVVLGVLGFIGYRRRDLGC